MYEIEITFNLGDTHDVDESQIKELFPLPNPINRNGKWIYQFVGEDLDFIKKLLALIVKQYCSKVLNVVTFTFGKKERNFIKQPDGMEYLVMIESDCVKMYNVFKIITS